MSRFARIVRFLSIISVYIAVAGFVNCAGAASQVPKHAVIFFSADTHNELFVCGCQEKLGGLSRRKTAVKSDTYPHVLVEVGGFAKGTTPFEKLKTNTIFKSYEDMGYSVINLGNVEYRLGRKVVDEFKKKTKIPFISANIADEKGKLIYPPYKIVTISGLKIGFIGVTSSAFIDAKPREGFTVLNIDQQVKKYVPEVKKQCDITVVLADARDNELQKLASSNLGMDIILGGLTFNYSEDDKPTKVGKTLIHKTGSKGKYLGRLRLDLKQSTPVKINNYEGFNVELDSSVKDDPTINKYLDEYRRILKTTDFTKSSGKTSDAGTIDSTEQPQPAVDSKTMAEANSRSGYTSALECAKCHPDIYNKWRLSEHANAFATLVQEGEEKNPQCIPCHVVGFNKIGGFVDKTTTPNLIGVQCECCHGAGAAHASNMMNKNLKAMAITKTVPEFFCVRCHNDQWDPEFNMSEKLPKVDHGKDKVGSNEKAGKPLKSPEKTQKIDK